MKLASALIRVSTSQQELDSQIYDLRLEASKLGYTIPKELIFGQKITGYDGGYGRDAKTNEVYRIADRDSISELKQACEQDKEGKIKAIFVWELSRLSRKPSTLLDYIEYFTTAKKPIFFTSHNIWTIHPQTGVLNDDGKVMINMLAVFGEQERNKSMERYQRGKRFALTEEDRYVGGYVPYGYDIEEINGKKYYMVHEERSKIIEEIYNRYLYDGWASDKIARYLNQKEVPTYYNIHNPDKEFTTNIGRKIKRSNIRWSHTSVLQILRNPFYKGERTYMDITTECTPIIEIKMWEEVQELMKDNNKFGKKTRKFNYPIKELLRCGECGSKFYGVVTSSKQNYYCNRFQLEGEKCNCNKLNKYRLDGVIWSFISNTPYIYEYFKYLYSEDNDADIINDLKQQNELDDVAILELKQSRKVIISRLGKPMYDDADLDEQALVITKEINDYQNNIRKRTSKINLLSKKQNNKITPEQIKKDIIDAGNDINKITTIINNVIEKITIYNIVERRFTLISINFNFGNIKDVNTTCTLVLDHSDRLNKFYYIGSEVFDVEERKFKLIKPIIPNDINMNDIGVSFEVLGSIEALKVPNQSFKDEIIDNLKSKYNITLEYELVDIYSLIENGITKMYDYEYIEVNPFTIANPEYVAYKKKDNARRNELKKVRKQRISKDYVKTPQEEYKYKVANIHNKRTKIRKMNISDEEKEQLLNETRIELDNIRYQYLKNT